MIVRSLGDFWMTSGSSQAASTEPAIDSLFSCFHRAVITVLILHQGIFKLRPKSAFDTCRHARYMTQTIGGIITFRFGCWRKEDNAKPSSSLH